MIASKIEKLRSLIPKRDLVSDHIDVKRLLSKLLHSDAWSENDLGSFIALLKKAEISKQLQTGYLKNWKKDSQASELTEPWVSIVTLLLFKLIVDEKKNSVQPQQLIKRINTLYKLLDNTTESWLFTGSPIRDNIESNFQKLVDKIPFDPNKPLLRQDTPLPTLNNKKVTIPLTVLFWEGPIARAYLETIYSSGFAPEKIIHLVSGLDISTGKPIASWLPSNIRKYYAASLQQVKINHWPNSISKKFPLLKNQTKKFFKSRFELIS